MALCSCASYSTDSTPGCTSNFDATTTYTGNASECTCEAQSILNDYSNQINTKAIDIRYSSDNEMHAKSCQNAILAKDKGMKINMIQDSGDHIYGYHIEMSKYTW